VDITISEKNVVCTFRVEIYGLRNRFGRKAGWSMKKMAEYSFQGLIHDLKDCTLSELRRQISSEPCHKKLKT
jgi:hypothetical protein